MKILLDHKHPIIKMRNKTRMWIALEVNGKIGKCYFATYYTLQASAVDKNREKNATC